MFLLPEYLTGIFDEIVIKNEINRFSQTGRSAKGCTAGCEIFDALSDEIFCIAKCILKMAFLKMALHCKNDISEDDFLYVFVRFGDDSFLFFCDLKFSF